MPSSLLALAPTIIHMVWEKDAKRILDVGPGRGKYGLLIREYVGDPERLDAVEMHDGYVSERLRAIYDEVIVEDVCELTDDELERYDLVLMADVIEHIEKDRALKLLERIPGSVIVSTPVEFFENPAELPDSERHVSHWTIEDFGERVELDCSQLGAVLVRLRARWS